MSGSSSVETKLLCFETTLKHYFYSITIIINIIIIFTIIAITIITFLALSHARFVALHFTTRHQN